MTGPSSVNGQGAAQLILGLVQNSQQKQVDMAMKLAKVSLELKVGSNSGQKEGLGESLDVVA